MTKPENNPPQATNEENNEPATPSSLLSPGWLWTARIAAGLSLVFVVAPAIAFNAVITGIIFSLPYLFVLYWLKETPVRHRVGRAIPLALFLGLAGLASIAFIAEGRVIFQWAEEIYFFAFFTLFQLALLASSAFLYFRLERRPLNWRSRLGSLASVVYPLFLLLAWVVVFLGLVRSPYPTNEASTVGSTRLLVDCAHNYRTSHPETGFPANITDIGPVAGGGNGCIDIILTAAANGGTPKSGYTFTYTHGEPNDEGIIETFSVTTVPARCGRTGVRTYFADQTGVIRFTNDQRAGCPVADANSPPLD